MCVCVCVCVREREREREGERGRESLCVCECVCVRARLSTPQKKRGGRGKGEGENYQQPTVKPPSYHRESTDHRFTDGTWSRFGDEDVGSDHVVVDLAREEWRGACCFGLFCYGYWYVCLYIFFC